MWLLNETTARLSDVPGLGFGWFKYYVFSCTFRTIAKQKETAESLTNRNIMYLSNPKPRHPMGAEVVRYNTTRHLFVPSKLPKTAVVDVYSEAQT